MPHCLRSLSLLVLTAFAAFAVHMGHAAESGAFMQPRAGLHAGGQPTARQLEQLAADGVRTVIDLRAADEPRGYDEAAASKAIGLRYVHLPIADGAALTPANAAALKHALDSSDGPVLLHCASGNRVGALLALMAAQQEDMPAQAALDLGKRAGLGSLEPVVRQHLGLPAPPDRDEKH